MTTGREKLAKARVVTGIPKGIPHDGIEDLWAEDDDTHNLNSHTARLVCLEEIKK